LTGIPLCRLNIKEAEVLDMTMMSFKFLLGKGKVVTGG
jgi:hypothetical protein